MKIIYRVTRAIEKPKEPPTNLVIVPVYIFEPTIFRTLREVEEGVGHELQLTDGIQKLVEWGEKSCAVELEEDELILDIGTSFTYRGLSRGHSNISPRALISVALSTRKSIGIDLRLTHSPHSH